MRTPPVSCVARSGLSWVPLSTRVLYLAHGRIHTTPARLDPSVRPLRLPLLHRQFGRSPAFSCVAAFTALVLFTRSAFTRFVCLTHRTPRQVYVDAVTLARTVATGGRFVRAGHFTRLRSAAHTAAHDTAVAPPSPLRSHAAVATGSVWFSCRQTSRVCLYAFCYRGLLRGFIAASTRLRGCAAPPTPLDGHAARFAAWTYSARTRPFWVYQHKPRSRVCGWTVALTHVFPTYRAHCALLVRCGLYGCCVCSSRILVPPGVYLALTLHTWFVAPRATRRTFPGLFPDCGCLTPRVLYAFLFTRVYTSTRAMDVYAPHTASRCFVARCGFRGYHRGL